MRFRSLTGKRLKVYVLADPAPGDDGNDDRGTASGGALVAWDDASASAVATSTGLRHATSGYLGSTSNPRLRPARPRPGGRSLRGSRPGNVVQAARTSLTGRRHGDELTLAIGFGRDADAAAPHGRTLAEHGLPLLRPALRRRVGAITWSRSSGRRVWCCGSNRLRRLYDQSVMVLAAHEDKLNSGASVASPTMPWVWGTLTLEGKEISGPYHLVWPRDFYHVATAQKAAGDAAAVRRLVHSSGGVQKPDGSWWQNTRVDGTPYWMNLQLDEVALPVVLCMVARP